MKDNEQEAVDDGVRNFTFFRESTKSTVILSVNLENFNSVLNYTAETQKLGRLGFVEISIDV